MFEDLVVDPAVFEVVVIGIGDQKIDNRIRVAGRQRLSDASQVPPRPTTKIGQRPITDTVLPVGKCGIESSRQGAHDFRVARGFRFLENSLERFPGTVNDWRPGNEL